MIDAETEDELGKESDHSTSEDEDNILEEIHSDTSSDSDYLFESSVSKDENITPSKRQTTEIMNSDDSQDEINDSENPTSYASQPNVDQTTARLLFGKKHVKWSSTPRSASTRTLRRNIVPLTPGPKEEARDLHEPRDLFSLFLTDHMLEQVVVYTNAEILVQKNRYKHKTHTLSLTELIEVKAFLGILLQSAAVKSNHLPTRMLFNTQRSGTIFKACMSAERFKILIKCLRFDDKQTRDVRKQDDKFAPIREFWQAMTENFQKWYTPGSYITVDEQVVGFRGKCPFRMYNPNKPHKNGINLVMAADVNSKYVLNAMPYLGKSIDSQKQPLATYFIKEITSSVHGTNRNITINNWFTSVPLADELLNSPYNLTLVGALRSKREIPEKLKNSKSRPVGSSIFCYDEEKTLVSYKAKSNKVVFVLSTIHDQPNVNESTVKPKIIHLYYSTKGAVDTVDQMCSNICTNRKTKRWPLCVFYNMINLATINSYAIHVSNNERNKKKPMSRRDFVMKMGDQLMEPWLRTRLQIVTLKRDLKTMIQDILGISSIIEAPVLPSSNVRKTCYLCPSKARRMTKHRCIRCKHPICGPHNVDMCSTCVLL